MHWFTLLGSLKNLTTGLIWLVTKVGGWGEVWEVHWFPLLGSLKNLTTGLIWLVTRVGGWGEAWGGGPWRAGKGESSVGATKGALWLPKNWSDLA